MSIANIKKSRRYNDGGAVDPLVGQQTGTESSLSSWAGPYVTDMLGKGKALSEMPYQAYGGPLTAGASDLQNKAFSGIAGAPMPTMNQTFTPMSFTDSGIASKFMNPYLQESLNPQLDEARRQAEMTRTNQAGRLTQAGAYGGSRQAVMESENNRNLLTNQSRMLSEGMSSAYDKGASQFNTDQARKIGEAQFGATHGLNTYGQLASQFNANQARKIGEAQFGAKQGIDQINALGQLGATQASTAAQEGSTMLSGLDAMLKAGGVQRDIYGEGVAADRAQFEEERAWPYKQLQFQQSMMTGLPLGTSTQSTSTSPIQQAGQIGGGLMDLYKAIQGLGI